MSEISGMMNMDLSSLFASPIAANAGVTVGAPGAAEPGVFGNLLDLVSDMQIGDEQGFEQSDFLENRVSELNDPAWKDVVATASGARSADFTAMLPIAQAPSPKNELSVGPRASLPKEAEGIPLVQDLALRFGELDTQARAQDLSLRAVNSDTKISSALPWAQALAANDIKSVHVDQDAFAELRKETSILPPALEKAPAFAKASAVAEAPVVKAAPTPAPTPVRAETVAAAAPRFESAAASLPRVKESVDLKASASGGRAFASMDTGVKPQPSASKGESDSNLGERPRPEHLRTEAAPQKEAVSGAEFLLARGAALPVGSDKAPQGLRQAASLGVHGDGRISPSTMDFVANKVDTLKAQGGGRLRVELSPGELGGMEIKVSMRRGHMVVELLAEKPETVAAFRQSSAELSSKLEGIAPSKLEIGDKTGGSLMARPTENPSVSSSQDLLQTRTHETVTHGSVSSESGLRLAETRSETRSDTGSSGEQSSRRFDQPSRFENFDRDERRNQAMSWWEMYSQEKKSA